MHRKAINHLRTADPALGAVIDKVGPFKLKPRADGSHFDHVVRSIVGQQLSGAAAQTIYKRVLGLKGGTPPTPKDFLKFPVETLRAAGLSGRKVEYVKELAQRTHDGSLAILKIHEMDDASVMETLVSVRGIGPWTAQMVLMFRLGRPDVFPELDLGVQKAIQKLRRMRKLPTPKQMTKIGTIYAPYRTYAAWYLWRSLELPGDSELNVAITGSTGLIGSALANALRADGDNVIPVPRGGSDVSGADAVVHLSGAPIAVRWNALRKHEIRLSRVRSTQQITDAIDATKPPPRVLICASAIGIYGNRGSEMLTEQSAPGDDYLAGVVREWETAARGTRVRSVQLRFGIVLSPDGGALAKMLPIFRMGMGGRLGTGAQWMSWIGLHDLVRAIRFAIASPDMNGAVNAVAPTPVTNADFTATLARVLRRPAVMPAFPLALRAVFGEMASLTMLASQRVQPARLELAGFRFDYPVLEGALRHELALPATARA